MRQLKSIIGLLLVGVFAYSSTFYPLQLWHNLQQEATILATISPDEEDVICVKIPMALPYSQEWAAPQEASGLMQHNGQFYNLLQKDFRKDTLYVYYVKNHNAREIFSSLSNYVQEQVAKTSSSSENKNPIDNQLVKLFKKDFFYTSVYQFANIQPILVTDLALVIPSKDNTYASRNKEILAPPPKI